LQVIIIKRYRCLINYVYLQALVNNNASQQKHQNIMPVIDSGMFHNYVHVCKQLFLYDAIADDRHLFHKVLTFFVKE